ncbi:hypothetical protein LTR64_007006 [Lithohypha guttulata]|uniref:uncharacterized protein n=1 Tax=Lithohypha guttulata TaxID=1690604 RepID=UPI00315DEDAB
MFYMKTGPMRYCDTVVAEVYQTQPKSITYSPATSTRQNPYNINPSTANVQNHLKHLLSQTQIQAFQEQKTEIPAKTSKLHRNSINILLRFHIHLLIQLIPKTSKCTGPAPMAKSISEYTELITRRKFEDSVEQSYAVIGVCYR